MVSFLVFGHSIACDAGRGSKTIAGAGMLRSIVAGLVTALAVLAATGMGVRAEEANDYPTAVRTEYVFGCMKANGESRQSIEQCSCSIDVVASLVPYERYVTAETVISMSQVQAEVRCF
jgi:hypothetical protein